MIFTTFDIAALLTVLVCLAISAMRGLMGEVVSFVGWIVALILARALAVPVSDVVFTSMNPRPMAVVCAFVLVYIAARIGIVLLHQVLDLVVKKVKLSGVNRMLGGILGTIKGVLVVGLVVLACSFSNLPQDPEWRNAATAPFFEHIALMEKDYLPDFLANQVQLPSKGNMQAALEAAGASEPASAKIQSLKP